MKLYQFNGHVDEQSYQYSALVAETGEVLFCLSDVDPQDKCISRDLDFLQSIGTELSKVLKDNTIKETVNIVLELPEVPEWNLREYLHEYTKMILHDR